MLLSHIRRCLLCLATVPTLLGATPQSVDTDEEPVAYIGHGAFFDARGGQIAMTPAEVERIHAWYEARLLRRMDAKHQSEFQSLRSQLTKSLDLTASERSFAAQAALSRAAQGDAALAGDFRTIGKLRALEYKMRRTLQQDVMKLMFFSNKPLVNLELLRRVDALDEERLTTKFFAATPNQGKAYVDECAAASVPIPPPVGQLDPMGRTGWKSEGFINRDEQFIVGSPAELRSFQSDKGMCYALPRFEDESKAIVALDGIICFSKTTAKACFWDNQMGGRGFSFPNGTKIPIGFPDTAVNSDRLYQAGGAELEKGTGGVCSDCHSGENPYIVHPKSVLSTGVTWQSVEDALPAFGPDRMTPLVPASWPQNAASQSDSAVPKACASCHSQEGPGGRLPQLSVELIGYCGTILAQALTKTMPPRNPGSQANSPEVLALLGACPPAMMMRR